MSVLHSGFLPEKNLSDKNALGNLSIDFVVYAENLLDYYSSLVWHLFLY